MSSLWRRDVTKVRSLAAGAAVDAVLEAASKLPLVGGFVDLLAKVNAKYKDVAATNQDAGEVAAWANLTTTRLAPIKARLSGEDADGPVDDAMRVLVEKAAEDVGNLLSVADHISSGSKPLSYLRTVVFKGEFDAAKLAVENTMKELNLAVNLDTNAGVHRVEEKVDKVTDMLAAMQQAKSVDEGQSKVWVLLASAMQKTTVAVQQVWAVVAEKVHERDDVGVTEALANADEDTQEVLQRTVLDGYRTSAAYLRNSCARRHVGHAIASGVLRDKYQHFIFIPLLIVGMAIAVLSFLVASLVASHQEGNWNVAVATVLTVITGVLGIVAVFINALDRYLDWRTLSEMHKKSSATYQRLQEDINPHFKHEDSAATVKRYNRQLETVELGNYGLGVPWELAYVFDAVEKFVHEKVKIHKDMARRSMGVENADGQIDYGFLFIDEVRESDILLAAYAIISNVILANKGWCRTALPERKALTREVIEAVNEGIMEVVFRTFGGSDIESG